MDEPNRVTGFIFATDDPFVTHQALIDKKTQYPHRHRQGRTPECGPADITENDDSDDAFQEKRDERKGHVDHEPGK